MSTYTRTTKSNGTTEWADGETITHTEHNDEWNTFLNDYNGGITDANISGSAAITPTKIQIIPQTRVDDLASNSITTYGNTTSPGDSATPVYPTSLGEEMLRLRDRIGAGRGYQTAYYMNSSGVITAARWFEPALTGRNLIPNPGFEQNSITSPNAPTGWSLVGTPSATALEDNSYTGSGKEKRSLRIATDADDEGISCVVSGLRPSTKYLVGMEYTLTDNGTVAGFLKLSTTDALGSGDYQDLALTVSTEAATTVSVLQGIVMSNATGDAVTVSITGTNAGLDANINYVWMYELTETYPFDMPSIPTQTARDTSASTYPSSGWTGAGSTWRTETLTSLSLTQYIPGPGYRLTYETSVPYSDVDASGTAEGARVYIAIQSAVDGGSASTVAGPVICEIRGDAANMKDSGTLFLRYVLDNPTPGSSYAMTTLLGVYDDANFEQVSIPPSVGGTQMAAESRLIMEKL